MSAPVNVAYINPQILSWARVRSGKSQFELETALKASGDEFDAWERGEIHPPFDKAQKIAQALSIPFGYLFLSKPPEVAPPLPDLRTLADRQPLSLNFLEVVNDALVKQDWFRDYLRENKESKLSFVGRFTAADAPAEVAKDIRRVLGINLALRRAAKDWGDYVAKLAHRSEQAGILIMRSGVVGNSTRRKLSSREFQGFAVTDPYAPIVFVNSDDFKTAQVFTLVHELAHIWIGTSAISHLDPTMRRNPETPVELFCNSVAVEALVPQVEFEAAWQDKDIESVAGRLSRHWSRGLRSHANPKFFATGNYDGAERNS